MGTQFFSECEEISEQREKVEVLELNGRCTTDGYESRGPIICKWPWEFRTMHIPPLTPVESDSVDAGACT